MAWWSTIVVQTEHCLLFCVPARTLLINSGCGPVDRFQCDDDQMMQIHIFASRVHTHLHAQHVPFASGRHGKWGGGNFRGGSLHTAPLAPTPPRLFSHPTPLANHKTAPVAQLSKSAWYGVRAVAVG